MSFKRIFHSLASVCLFAQCASLIAQPVGGLAYPNRPIQLIVGIGAGSNTDALARLAAKRLSERLKQPVIVENRAGAGGTIGAGLVAGAAPDGYTLLWGTSSVPMFAHLNSNLKFDPVKDLVGVSGVAEGGLVMLTRTNAPWKNLAELVAYGKSKPPGAITYASAGIGSNAYLFSEIFAQATGLEFLHVPYKGSSAALTDVMAGQIDFVFDGPSTAIPQVDAGRVRALAFSTKNRSPFMPAVPSMQEAGTKGFAQRTWLEFFAPMGTPKAIVDRLSQEIQSFVAQPSFRDDLAAVAHEPMKIAGPEFTDMVRKESDEWAVRLKAMKMPLN